MGFITNSFQQNVVWQPVAAEWPILTEDHVHVWRINISLNIPNLPKCRDLLNVDERARAGRYKQQKDTDRFIVSRAAQRIILGRYIGAPPSDLNFITGNDKKPYLDAGEANVLHHNLSHAGDWIVLALSKTDVGVDVEFVDQAFKFEEILEENFSADEISFIGEDTTNFFTSWTRKEAILKATGQGLGDHLKFTPALNGKYEIPKALIGNDRNWILSTFECAPFYIASVVSENVVQQLQFFETQLT